MGGPGGSNARKAADCLAGASPPSYLQVGSRAVCRAFFAGPWATASGAKRLGTGGAVVVAGAERGGAACRARRRRAAAGRRICLLVSHASNDCRPHFLWSALPALPALPHRHEAGPAIGPRNDIPLAAPCAAGVGAAAHAVGCAGAGDTGLGLRLSLRAGGRGL